MKKGQVYEGIVERIDFPNKGIVIVDNEKCVVKNALPGQKVRFLVNKLRKGKAEGRLLEILEKSETEKKEGVCPHFGICGGCTYISLPYEKQLEIKEKQVKELLDSVLCKQEQPYIFESIKRSPKEYEYRNKMEFSFGDEVKDGPLSLGMHKRGSFYDVVKVDNCQIVDEDYRKILTATLSYFDTENASFYHRLRHVGFLRHLLVRKASGTGEILIALVTTSQKPLQKETADVETTENVTGEIRKLLAEYNALPSKTFEDIVAFHVAFERIHPFQDGNGRVGRLILFKECLKHNIVPFIIEDNLKLFYYRGLKEWDREKGFLLDTCLTAQDRFKVYLDYFRIAY